MVPVLPSVTSLLWDWSQGTVSYSILMSGLAASKLAMISAYARSRTSLAMLSIKRMVTGSVELPSGALPLSAWEELPPPQPASRLSAIMPAKVILNSRFFMKILLFTSDIFFIQNTWVKPLCPSAGA